jgi:membrane dipeptidase
MIIVDAHCDTITKIMEDDSSLCKNSCHTDLERMKTAGNFVQFFAAFIEPSFCQAYAMRRAVQIFDRFHEQIEKCRVVTRIGVPVIVPASGCFCLADQCA